MELPVVTLMPVLHVQQQTIRLLIRLRGANTITTAVQHLVRIQVQAAGVVTTAVIMAKQQVHVLKIVEEWTEWMERLAVHLAITRMMVRITVLTMPMIIVVPVTMALEQQ